MVVTRKRAQRLSVILLLIAMTSASDCSRTRAEEFDSLEPRVQTIHPRIAFRDSTGREIAPENIQSFRGFRWFIEDLDSVPMEAATLHSKAQEIGSKGDYDESLRLLWRAHQICPGWLHPVYDAAWTYFLKGDSKRAEQLYTWVDQMEPRGYWTTKEALDCLRKEGAGKLTRGAYGEYTLLEWVKDPSERREKLEALVKRAPSLAPAWKDLAVLREAPLDKLNAVETGLASSPDAETLGFLLLHKADILVELGRNAEADSIRTALASSPTSTMQTRALAQFKLTASRGKAARH